MLQASSKFCGKMSLFTMTLQIENPTEVTDYTTYITGITNSQWLGESRIACVLFE